MPQALTQYDPEVTAETNDQNSGLLPNYASLDPIDHSKFNSQQHNMTLLAFTLEVHTNRSDPSEDMEMTNDAGTPDYVAEASEATGDRNALNKYDTVALTTRKSRSAATALRRQVHFSETDHVQMFDQSHKAKDVKSLSAFIRTTSNKVSWLRNPHCYDWKIQLQVRSSASDAHIPLNIAQIKDSGCLDVLWMHLLRVNGMEDPYQMQFRLDGNSRPAEYDTREDEKRFRFGNRANEQVPAFIKRCQAAARAQVQAEEDQNPDQMIGDNNGNIIGVIELLWRN